VRRQLKRTYRFVCLTDAPPPHRDWLRAHRINLRPLVHGWPGAWAKIELFRPGLFAGRVLALDLDTLATGSVTTLADCDRPFATLSDFLRPGHLDTSIMAWQGGALDFIHAAFAAEAEAAMTDFADPTEWIAHCCRRAELRPDRLQDLAPGLCATATPIAGGAPIRAKPPGVGLICFHGNPKPHQLVDDYDLVRRHWV
jgi:hypothetical protein